MRLLTGIATLIVTGTLAFASPLVLTKSELAEYNGKLKPEKYVAVNGVVYDVSKIPAWITGMHHGGIAGTDLSAQIVKAPHGLKVLQKLTKAGVLTEPLTPQQVEALKADKTKKIHIAGLLVFDITSAKGPIKSDQLSKFPILGKIVQTEKN